ncbi:MAG: YeeE/YedE thiosulfate transporter family protein [Ignisphaera sp.]
MVDHTINDRANTKDVISFKKYLESNYFRKVFGSDGWPIVVAGILIGLINVVSYVWVKKPFTVYTGFLNWGQHIYSLLGLSSLADTPKTSPLLDPTSAGDIGAILGAMIAAILSNEFRLRGVDRLGVIESIVGGVLMALGVSMSFGCNWGGFLSAITSWSLHGYAFLLGALAGGYLGQRYVLWRAEKTFRLESKVDLSIGSGYERKREAGQYGVLLVIPLTIIILASIYYAYMKSYMIGGLLIGVTMGMILQRARFCFATAFRDLFGGPEALRAINIHKGIAVAMLVGATGVFALKYMGLADIWILVSPVYITNVIGGAIFIFGAIMVGGCASGILWRIGEGHLKALIGLISTVLAYPMFVNIISKRLVTYPRIFMPGAVGWIAAYAIFIIFISIYLMLLLYQEYRLQRERGLSQR